MNPTSTPAIVPAGSDLLTTSTEGAVFHFDRIPIPAGFFSPRSAEFASPVTFRGRPLPSQYFRGLEVTHVDTVVERTHDVELSPPYPSSATVPIEILGLALQCMKPIEVRVGSRIEEWDVTVDLSKERRSRGTMQITKTGDEGGVFDSELAVFPLFTFTRTCDGKQKVLDLGALPLPPEAVAQMTMRSRATPWRHEARDTLRIRGLNDAFVAGAPGRIMEQSDGCIHPVDEAPACDVIIIASSRCLCLGKDRSFTARGSPGGGTYSWSIITQGAGRAALIGAGTSRHVDVRGTAASSSANDIRLQVVYQSPTGGSCSASIGLTTVEARLRLRTSGMWDPDNGIPQDPRFGVPQLGPVSPGNPPETRGRFKNIEIEALIRPNDRSLPCTFDFKRTRAGRSGVLTPSGNFLPDSLDCPSGACDDDLSNADEDLTLSGAGTIYDADTPGFFLDPPACTQQTNDATRLSCLNFRNWLEIDGQQCGPTILWHAHTRVRCDNQAWVETAAAVGAGHIACTVGGAVTRPRPFSTSEAVRLLQADDPDDRAEGYGLVKAAQAAGVLTGEERGELVRALIQIPRRADHDEQLGSPAVLAIQLLGELRAEEAVPALVARVRDDFGQPVTSALATPAAHALRRIGASAIPVILDQAEVADDDQWTLLDRLLRNIEDQKALRREACSKLDAEISPLAERRLDHLLRQSGRVHHVRRSTAV